MHFPAFRLFLIPVAMLSSSIVCFADGLEQYLGSPRVTAVNNAGNPPENVAALLEGQADFDGDGRNGSAENTDGDDGVFGTFAAIPGFLTDESEGGLIYPATRYNSVTVATSGVFREFLRTSYFGLTTIEAAPGIRAVFDAVGVDEGTSLRKNSTAVVIHGHATLRNLTFRNWNQGVQVASDGVLTVEGCHFENLVTAGIRVAAGGRLVLVDSTITRCGAATSQGAGLVIEAGANAVVKNCTITDNLPVDIQGRSKAQIVNTIIGDKNQR